MKKDNTGKIDELASRAIGEMIEDRKPSADSQNKRTAPKPEYLLGFRMDDRKDTFQEKANSEIFTIVAAALALFMLLPALAGGSKPTIEQSLASARDSGELAILTDEIKETMTRVSLTLQH